MPPLDFSSQGEPADFSADAVSADSASGAPDFSGQGTPADFSADATPASDMRPGDTLRQFAEDYLTPDQARPPITSAGEFAKALGSDVLDVGRIFTKPVVTGLAGLIDRTAGFHPDNNPAAPLTPDELFALMVLAPEISPAAGTGKAIAHAADQQAAERAAGQADATQAAVDALKPKAAPDFSAEGVPAEEAPAASVQEAAATPTPPAPDFASGGVPVAPAESAAASIEGEKIVAPEQQAATAPDFAAPGEPVTLKPAEFVEETPASGEAVTNAAPDFASAGEAVAPEEGIRAIGPMPKELTEPRIQQPISKQVVNAAADLLTQGKVTRDPSLLLSDQIAELLQTDRLSVPQIKATLDAHGITLEQFSADLWRTNIRKAAQDMQTLSALSQRLGDLASERGAAADLAEMGGGINPVTRAMGFWKRLDNIRRGLMVTQLSTAMRNFEGQTARLGLDVLQQGLDAGLRRIFGAAGISSNETAAPDAMGALIRFFRPLKTKRAVDQVLSRFPKASDKLFGNFMSDVATKPGGADLLGKATTGVRILNVANTFQEYAVRRAIFAATLDRELANRGMSLEDLIAKNRIGAIPRDALDASVKNALELTFAKNFSPFAPGAEGMAGKFVSFVTGTPLSLALPFPRFLMNSVKFLYDFSPAGFLKLLKPEERAKIAAGDMASISRATLGTAMLFGAYQLRNSQYAGERWYELKLPDGRTVDMRPFAPFSAYLFVADLAKRSKDGTLNRLTTKDIASGLLSTNVRAGAGLYAVDAIINGLVAKDSPEKALRAIEDFAGEVAASFLTPLNMVSDLFAQFDKQEQAVRTGREGPYVGFGEGPGDLPKVGINLGPVMREIPGLDVRLPQVQQATRSEGMVKESPLLKALTGIALNSPKNGLEQELDRLGFTSNEIVQSTGEPEADRLIAQRMGPIAEKALVPLVQSERYKALSDPVKAELLALALSGVRRAAIETARTDDPLLFARIRLLDMPQRQREVIEQALGRSIDSLIPRKR